MTALEDTREVEVERELITIKGKGLTQEIECLPEGIALVAAHQVHVALAILRRRLIEKLCF